MTNTNSRREELLNDIAYAQDLIDWHTAEIENLKAEKTQIGNERYEINRVRYSQFRITASSEVSFVRNLAECRAIEDGDTIRVYEHIPFVGDNELSWRALPRVVKSLIKRALHLAKSLASSEKFLSNWVAEQAEAKAELALIETKTDESGYVQFKSRNWNYRGDKGTWARVNKDGSVTVKRASYGIISGDYTEELRSYCESVGINFDTIPSGGSTTVWKE